MQTFDVAHVREQGQDIILVLVRREPTREQYAALQVAANSAGLAGHVVAVWDAGFGRPGFLGPQRWGALLRSLSWLEVLGSVNKRLTVS